MPDAFEFLRSAAHPSAARDPSAACLAVLSDSLFGPQRAFIENRVAIKRAACCSRRAGKTQGIIRGLLARCVERPRSVAVYFSITLKSAARMVWDCPDGIPSLIKDLGIDAICTINETNHRVDFANGSVLWVAGAETLGDARNWKGLRYDIGVLDEAQDWVDEILAYMINEALAPALMDRRGELLVTGTPGPYLGGLFYEITNGMRPGWVCHGYDFRTRTNAWTCLQNPHIPDAEAFIRADVESRGLSMDDPIVQREYRGLWVRDVQTLLYQYLPGRNDFAALPMATEWRHVLGMDVGVRDLATYCLASFRQHDPCVYFSEVRGEAASEKTAPVTRMAEVIHDFQRVYGPGIGLVMDAGALGLGYQLELLNRFKLNVQAAKKVEKAAAIRLMNDQIRLGNVKAGPGSDELKKQWQKLQIDPKTQIEKPTQACDYADAALYAWRACYAFLAVPAPDATLDGQRREMVSRVIQERIRVAQGGDSMIGERRQMAEARPFDR